MQHNTNTRVFSVIENLLVTSVLAVLKGRVYTSGTRRLKLNISLQESDS